VLSADLLDALDRGALDGPGLLQVARDRLAWPGSYDDLAAAWGAAFEPDAAVLAVAGRLRVPAVLLTNNGAPLADRFAQLLPSVAAVVRASFFSAHLSTTKPDSAAFLRASERLGCAPGTTLLVDDSEANVRSARAAGLDALQFTGVSALARDLSTRQLLTPAP
jgi:FMN phosphatase YigB (HAD superfamily)